MFGLFKKERPVQGLTGMGGGAGGYLVGGGAPVEVTGGTKITTPNYHYHVFTSNQDFVVGSPLSVELLVVGGGGAAAGPYSAGGGAGGIAYGPSVPVVSGTYAVVIGNGGTQILSPSLGNANTPGDNSSITLPVGTITGLGGGTGGQDMYQTGPDQYNPGGSGGGNGDDSSPDAGDATQPGQPNFGVGILHYGNPGHEPPSGNAPGPLADGGGGGGAGSGGGPTHTATTTGGSGQPFPNFPAPVLSPAIPSPERTAWQSAVTAPGLFGGGGNGGRGPTSKPPGGGGQAGVSGIEFTGGGGGGNVVGGPRGDGGNGIVIIKYPV